MSIKNYIKPQTGQKASVQSADWTSSLFIGGRVKTTCLNSRKLYGLYCTVSLPAHLYHTCVCNQLLQIYPCSTTCALLLFGGPYMAKIVYIKIVKCSCMGRFLKE